MKKAITFIALASVAMSSEVYENELFKLKDVVADVKNIKHDIKTHHIDSAIHHGVDTIRDITGKDSKFLHKVDEDVEKFKKFAAKHPELVEKVHDQLKKYRDHKVLKADVKKAADFIEKLHAHKKHTVEHDDDELFKFKDFIHHAEKDIKKATHFVQEHPAVVEDGFKIAKDIKHKDYKNLVHDGVQTLKDLGFEDDELAHFKDLFKHIKEDVKKAGHFVQEHPEVIQDGANIAKDIKHKDYKNLIHDGVETLRHLGFEDDELFVDGEILAEFDDEELFSLKKVFESVKNGVAKGVNFIQGHPAVIKDGVNIVKDIKNKDVKGLIKDGIQTYKDVKAHDDEEFSLKKIGEKVGHVVEKGAHLVKDGANLVKDYKTGNVIGLIKDGKQTIKDIKAHDDEEFSLKKIGEKVGHVVEKGAHLVKDGANLVKDYKTGNVIGLIKDGKQTIKDIKAHDDEEFSLKKIGEKVGHVVEKGAHLAKDGANLVKDYKTGNVIGLIKDGKQTIKDIKAHDDEEFSLKKIGEKVGHVVEKGAHLVKDGANLVKDYKTGNVIGLIKDGKQTIKDIKAHDDEEFSLKKIGEKVGHVVEKGAHLAKDGANLVKDYKTGNVIGLIKDGKQTIKDIKAHDDEEFSLKKIGEKVGHVVEKGAHLAKDGANLVKDYKTGNVIGLIKDGKQTIKDIKSHDDEELFAAPVKIYRDLGFEDQTDNSLFSLKDLIRDGSHIAHDIKNKDYGSLIKDGVQTVKDIKNKDKKFLF